jgi:hypothetical protein
MKNLKQLVLTFSVISVFATIAFAGEMQSPPCAPGEMQSPPCTSAQLVTDEPSEPSQTSTPPSASNVDLTSTLEEAAIAFLLF